MTGVERGDNGVARYADRPASLVHLLRASVDRDAAASAVVEVGAGSLSYAELWDRAARIAGGLRAAGIERGDRVAIRLQNGIDWVLAFFGAQLAGAVAVPVNTRFTEEEAAYVIKTRERLHVCARRRAARRRAGRRRGSAARRSRRDLLHQRHHRLSQGRDDLARRTSPPTARTRSAALRSTRSEGPRSRPDVRAAVSRHGLQQPADPGARARRQVVFCRARSTSTGFFAPSASTGSTSSSRCPRSTTP